MPAPRKTRRLGLLLPSSNSTQEPEFASLLPPDVSLHCGRLTLNNVDPESTVRMVEELEHESRKLADADVGVILLAATAPSSRKGPGYDRELQGRIETASGRPATTASTAMLDAFRTLGIERVALAAPWSEEVNRGVAAFIEASGVAVVRQHARGVVRNNDIGLLDPETACESARQVDSPQAQAVFLACGNWATLGVIEQLEQELGKPVLSTNLVSLWAALRILGQTSPIAAHGSLLGRHMQAEEETR